ncbi:unnamed protein product [Boreogadus saida]
MTHAHGTTSQTESNLLAAVIAEGGELSRRVLVVRRRVLQTEEQQTREPHRARVYPRHPENTERRGRTVPLRGLLLELIFYRDRVSSGAQRGSAWFFA